jgi:hypothetical protein
MIGKSLFAFVLCGVGYYSYNSYVNYDPALFDKSADEIAAILVNAKTEIPRRDNEGTIVIKSEGRSGEQVLLTLQYHSTARVISCAAKFEMISPAQTRVIADCPADKKNGSALDRRSTHMFVEHIQSVLTGHPFDRQRAESNAAAYSGGLASGAFGIHD